MDEMRTQTRRAFVKHAVGRRMFCEAPKCGAMLDARKAAVITPPDGGALVVCLGCLTPERIELAVCHGGEIDAWDWKRGGSNDA